jgi:hypothetical protein
VLNTSYKHVFVNNHTDQLECVWIHL